MLTQISIKECMGKKLKGFALSHNEAVLVFDGNVFTGISIDRGWGSGDEEIEFQEISVWDFGNDALKSVGVIAQEDIDFRNSEQEKRKEMAKAQFITNREKRDRSEYARLKKKYEI